MGATRAFIAQRNGCTVRLDATGISQTIPFDGLDVELGIAKRTSAVRLLNAGGATVFVELGGQAITAAAVGGIPIGAGKELVLATQGATHLAAVAAGGTSTIYATPGDGGI